MTLQILKQKEVINMLFNSENGNDELKKDLSHLLKQEGSFVKELSETATKAAEFHARLESIEKALASDPSSYSSKKSDEMVQKAKDKYSCELEDSMKSAATDQIKSK